MRSARIILLLLATLFALSLHSVAQQLTATPTRDPQAVAILTQSLTAVGASALSIQDSVAQGNITLPDGTTGTITMKTRGTTQLRHEVNLPTGQTVLVVSGATGYSVYQGKKRPLSLWIAQHERPVNIPAVSRLADIALPNTNLIYIALEDVAGRPTHHVRLTALPTDNTSPEIEEIISDFHVFIDQQNLLPVKTLSWDFSPEIIENRSAVETYFSDYRQVSGALVPFDITRYVAGQKQWEITITSVVFNVGLTASDFQ